MQFVSGCLIHYPVTLMNDIVNDTQLLHSISIATTRLLYYKMNKLTKNLNTQILKHSKVRPNVHMYRHMRRLGPVVSSM